MIALHITAALLATGLGAWQLLQKKGTVRHRHIGHIWVLAMVVTALSSFWIRSNYAIVGPFGPIHVLSVWVLACLVMAIIGSRQQRIRLHVRFMVGAYMGLLGAGLAAVLVPGRMLSLWLTGG